jgi:hypothetical protein
LIQDDRKALDLLDQGLQNPLSLHLNNAVDNVHSKGRPAGNSVEAALRRLRSDPRRRRIAAAADVRRGGIHLAIAASNCSSVSFVSS